MASSGRPARLNVQTTFHEALRHHQAGRLDIADKLYRQILSVEPRHADSLNLLGLINQNLGQIDAANGLIRQALRLRNDSPMYHNNLANVLRDQRKLDEAEEHYRHAIRLNPAYAEAHYNFGRTLQDQGKFKEALTQYECAARLQPNLAAAHNNIASVCKELGMLNEAMKHCRRALTINPDMPEAHYSMGMMIKDEDKINETETHFRRAIALKPNYDAAHNSLGAILRQQGLHDEALRHFRKATAINPNNVEAHVNEATTLLLKGNLTDGWRKYEWRRSLKGFNTHESNKPLWDGGILQGKTILLLGEQGLGDCIQFIRYASTVKDRGGNILLVCNPALRRLFGSMGLFDHILSRNSSLPDHDCYAPLLSLPMLLNSTLDTVPNSVPYLCPSADDVASWAKRLDTEGYLKVGLVWAGGSHIGLKDAHTTDLRRSINLSQLVTLGDVPGVKFFSLQKDDLARQLDNLSPNLTIVDHMSHVDDFSDTAAFIANLDLVISVDTSVAHLAGAMGKPVWVLSRFDGCWRWLLDREDSPWYPTLRLFRQPSMGDWQSVIEKVRVALAAFVRARSLS